MRRIAVFLNPRASSAKPRELHRALKRMRAARPDISWDLTRVRSGALIESLVARALSEGCDALVAAGGDGTVSAVARAALGSGVPVGVIPMGAGDVLAEQLGIPGDLDEALQVIADGGSVRHLDAMEIGGRLALLNVGVGVSAAVVRDTPSLAKRIFGRVAYFVLALFESLRERPQDFRLLVDGSEKNILCLEILAINAGLIKQRKMPGFPLVRPDDASVNVMLMWVPTARVYLAHAMEAFENWRAVDPNLQWLEFRDTLRIESARPTEVQADGDVVGSTPVEVRVRPGLIPVLVPENGP